ncbi:putative UPF0481 protein [Tanacetum coccineum]
MSNINNKQPQDLTDYDGISQSDVTTKNLSNSDEASTPTPIFDRKGFLLGFAKKGGDRKKQRPPTICKVSRILRDLSESSFDPQLVSIGPIHREDPKLKEYEWLKECYLHDLLSRRKYSTQEETLEACLLKVNTLIPRIRESYGGMIEKYSDDEVATMMVMDGCFILEFCLKFEDEMLSKMQHLRIAKDLILLENQVPFFVLQALFDLSMGKVSFTLSKVLDVFLACYINIFRSGSLLPETTIHVDSDSTHDHVLGYLHKRYQLVVVKPSNPIRALISKLAAAKLLNPIRALISKLEDKKGTKNTPRAFHSIVELDRSGMHFKPHQEDRWSMTIKFQSSPFACLPWFWSKPTLLMPTLVIHDSTELILRNFIAYEQSFPQDRYYFTSYAHAMDMLIYSQEDIAKLVESKVLVNMLGSNQEAAEMINKTCKNIILTDFYYTDIQKK